MFRIQRLTRRLCVLSNTKLYHQNLLLWISTKLWIAKKKHFPPQLKNKTLIKFVAPTLDFAQKIHLSQEKYPKIEIRSSWSQFEYYSDSLV